MTTVGRPELATHNHMALDQLMDLRNDTMKIVYPFANVVTTRHLSLSLGVSLGLSLSLTLTLTLTLTR